jgi:GNAT superfamily N-acetyltransferase
MIMMTMDGKVGAQTVTIRDARQDELEHVAALILESFGEFENEIPRSVWEAAVAEWADVRGRLDEARLIVAEMGGRLVGTVTFYPEASLSRTEEWPAGWAAIRIFCVHPSARGHGIGRMLTDECIRLARARAVPTIALKTGQFMVVARALYEQAGFVRDPSMDHGWTGNGHVQTGMGGTVHALAYRYDFKT